MCSSQLGGNERGTGDVVWPSPVLLSAIWVVCMLTGGSCSLSTPGSSQLASSGGSKEEGGREGSRGRRKEGSKGETVGVVEVGGG